MIEQALFQLVTQESTIQSAVGVDANGTTRAYWILAPQGAIIPFLIFSRVGTTENYAMSGTTGLREALFQIVCYSSTYYQSRNISGVVRNFLKNYTGTLPDSTVVDSIFIEKDWDDRYEEGSKGFVYGAYLQFRVWFIG